MPFVIEEKSPEMKEKYPNGRRWVIDHERDAFSIRTSGDSEYTLSKMGWGNEIIEIIYQKREIPREREMPSTGWTYIMELTIDKIYAPRKLQEQKNELRQLVEDYLTALYLMVKANVGVNIININEQSIRFTK